MMKFSDDDENRSVFKEHALLPLLTHGNSDDDNILKNQSIATLLYTEGDEDEDVDIDLFPTFQLMQYRKYRRVQSGYRGLKQSSSWLLIWFIMLAPFLILSVTRGWADVERYIHNVSSS